MRRTRSRRRAGIGRDFEQRLDRRIVELDGIAGETVLDDGVPLGVTAGRAFAQHLRVVDFANLYVRPPAVRPRGG